MGRSTEYTEYLKQANEKKYKFVYQTRNIINNKTYIGYHCTDNLDDGYIGCGCRSWAYARACLKYGLKSAFLSAVVKYGYENFKREILCFYDTVEECLQEEMRLVNDKYVKSKNNYNNRLGGMLPPSNKITTQEEDQLIFDDFMAGMKKEDICKKYGISESVVYRITKYQDTTNRIKPTTKKAEFIENWTKNHSEYYIDLYKKWKITKEEVNKLIPFDLWRNDFLLDIERDKRFICESIEGERFTFNTAKELSETLNITMHSAGFLPVVNGKYKQYKTYKFYRNE